MSQIIYKQNVSGAEQRRRCKICRQHKEEAAVNLSVISTMVLVFITSILTHKSFHWVTHRMKQNILMSLNKQTIFLTRSFPFYGLK